MCTVQCACALCARYFSKNRLQECLRNQNSCLHTKLQLSSLKNKKVGKTARNVHCTVCVCARSAPKIVQNALVLLRNIIGIIKTHIHDNHIEFEVSGRFGGVWPTVRRAG